MATVPGLVMALPGSGRSVWVRAEDRAAWETRGYVPAEREQAAPLAADDTDEAPAAASAEAGDAGDRAGEPPPQPPPEPATEQRGGVDYPRRSSRGRVR